MQGVHTGADMHPCCLAYAAYMQNRQIFTAKVVVKHTCQQLNLGEVHTLQRSEFSHCPTGPLFGQGLAGNLIGDHCVQAVAHYYCL